jgi:Cu/Ag efflux pump CusA
MREKLAKIPGIQVVMAQPISDRVDEMVTGVRSDIAVKVFGDDLDQLKTTAEAIARVGRACRAPRISASRRSPASSTCPSTSTGRRWRVTA